MLVLVSIAHFDVEYDILLHCNVERQQWEDAADCGETLTKVYKFVYSYYLHYS